MEEMQIWYTCFKLLWLLSKKVIGPTEHSVKWRCND